MANPEVLNKNLIVNGDFDTAGGGTPDIFGTWSEITGGTSTIVRDTTSEINGPNSCRFDIDATGGYAFLRSSITLVPNTRYRLSCKHKTSSGTATMKRLYFITTDGEHFLLLDGTWSATATYISLPQGNGIVQSFSIDFTSLAVHTDYYFYPYAGGVGDESKSVWFDDCVIARIWEGTVSFGNHRGIMQATRNGISYKDASTPWTPDEDNPSWGINVRKHAGQTDVIAGNNISVFTPGG
jgi:hypothetical protein